MTRWYSKLVPNSPDSSTHTDSSFTPPPVDCNLQKMPGGNPRPLKVALATTYKIPQIVLANTNIVLRIHLFHFTHTFHGHGASDLSVGGIGQGEEVFDGCARPRSPRHLSEDNVVIVSGKVLRSYASRIPRTPKTQLRVAYYQLVG